MLWNVGRYAIPKVPSSNSHVSVIIQFLVRDYMYKHFELRHHQAARGCIQNLTGQRHHLHVLHILGLMQSTCFLQHIDVSALHSYQPRCNMMLPSNILEKHHLRLQDAISWTHTPPLLALNHLCIIWRFFSSPHGNICSLHVWAFHFPFPIHSQTLRIYIHSLELKRFFIYSSERIYLKIVLDILGYKVRLRFEGYGMDSSHDFTLHLLMAECYSLNGAVKAGHIMKPPKG